MIKDIIKKLSLALIPGPSKEIVLKEASSTMLDDINLSKEHDKSNKTNKVNGHPTHSKTNSPTRVATSNESREIYNELLLFKS